MAQRHEQRRLERDLEWDDKLLSKEGRHEYWDVLKERCSADSLIALLESTLDIEGEIIECGVYRGTSLFNICRSMADKNCSKTVYACDSFGGFPPESIDSHDTSVFRSVKKLQNKFTQADDVPSRIERFCSYFGASVIVKQGYFAQTLPELTNLRFSFIHLDVDIYSSYKECLDLLFPRLTVGGVVAFDDYGSKKWPGATAAVDEYFAIRPECVEQSTDRSSPAWFVRKSAV